MTPPAAPALAFALLAAAPPEIDPAAVRAALEVEIVAPHETLARVRDFAESNVADMPPAEDADAWRAAAEGVRKRMLDEIVFAGKARAWRDIPTEPVWLDSVRPSPAAGYTIRKLRFEAVPGFWIPALLYVPDDLPADAKVPLSLNVNGHDPKGKSVDYKQIRCANMAKRGMIVLNLEWINMGQLAHPKNNHYLLNAIDLCGAGGHAVFHLAMSRGIDILLQHPNADPERLLVTGLSGGGWQTIFLSALDTRVKMAVPVAGYSSFKTRARHASDLGDSEQTPRDMAVFADYAHFTAMLAPRPALLVFNAKDNCCFRADHALPPLLAAAGPVYDLLGAPGNLSSHINNDPGDHNYGEDNRKALYRFIGEHFYRGRDFETGEIDVSAEVLPAEKLDVPLPGDALTLNDVAKSLAAPLPLDPTPPAEAEAAEAWAKAKREALRECLRAPNLAATPERVSRESIDGLGSVQRFRIEIGSFVVPAVLIIPPGANDPTDDRPVALVIADGGRKSDEVAKTVARLVADNRPVAVADILYHGECRIAERDFLHALLLSATGNPLLGIQSGQILALAARLNELAPNRSVELVALGEKTALAALAAAAIDKNKNFRRVTTPTPPPTLKSLVETAVDVSKHPAAFPYGLLEIADVPQLRALAGPAAAD